MEDYKKLDVILKFISNADSEREKFSIKSLKDNLFNELNEAEIKLLIDRILEYKHEICKVFVVSGNRYLISSNDLTIPFLQNGGFTKIYEDEMDVQKRHLNKENLEIDNLSLTKSNLTYSESIRKQQEEISRLTIENLKLTNRNNKRYILYSVIAFVLGAIVTNLIDILTLLKIIPQK